MNMFKKNTGFVKSALIIMALVFFHASLALADPNEGKRLFSTKKCKTCHKAQGDPAVFKPVGPGLKDVGKRHSREWLFKWLSPKNVEIWESNDAKVQDIKARYKAAKKRDIKKSQMVKNFKEGKGGKAPKISLSDAERNHIIDFLLTL